MKNKLTFCITNELYYIKKLSFKTNTNKCFMCIVVM